MRLSRSAFCLAFFVFAAPLRPSDSTFRHPAGFAVLVPDGWKAESQTAGVVVSKGTANLDIFAFPGNGSPESLLETVGPQITQQWRSIKKIKQSACPVADRNGVCAWFSGVNPKGQATDLKVAALVQDGHGFLLFVETPQQNANAFTADLTRIEQSFSPAAGAKTAAAPVPHRVDAQKLAALDKSYQDGQISTEEYERRKQQLQDGSAGSSDSGGLRTAPVSPSSPSAENSASQREPPQAPPPQTAPLQNPSGLGSDGGQHFASPDGFFTTSVPPGWIGLPPGSGNTGFYFFAPVNGGAERIMVGSGPLYTNNIQQVLSSAFMTFRTLYPGLQLVGRPTYFKHGSFPAGQFRMRGLVANGALVSSWYGLVMAGNRYFYVFSLALPRSADRVEQDAHAVFNNFQF